VGAQAHGLAVRTGALERPHADHEGEVVHLEDAGHLEIELAVHRNEAAQRRADAGSPVGQGPGLAGERRLALIERHEALEITRVDPGDDRLEHMLGRGGGDVGLLQHGANPFGIQ